jgi:hypothetical protein
MADFGGTESWRHGQFFFCFAFLRWRDFTMRRCFFLNGVIAIHLLIIGATTGLKQQFEW